MSDPRAGRFLLLLLCWMVLISACSTESDSPVTSLKANPESDHSASHASTFTTPDPDSPLPTPTEPVQETPESATTHAYPTTRASSTLVLETEEQPHVPAETTVITHPQWPTKEGPAIQRTMGVVLVAADDSLNLRENPGVGSPILETLHSTQTNLIPTGQTAVIDGKPWYEITTGHATGWVHGRYVTEQWHASEVLWWGWRPPSRFRKTRPPRPEGIRIAALDRFATALTTGIGLAETVSWRGLYVILEHTPLRLEPDLHADTRHNWGFVAPNDDVPVTATLQEVATAFLADYHDPDVLVPIEGLPRWGYNSVPQEFANFPWVAIHDPGDKEEYSGFDWTTWVVFLELDGHNVPRVVGLQKQEWGP